MCFEPKVVVLRDHALPDALTLCREGSCVTCARSQHLKSAAIFARFSSIHGNVGFKPPGTGLHNMQGAGASTSSPSSWRKRLSARRRRRGDKPAGARIGNAGSAGACRLTFSQFARLAGRPEYSPSQPIFSEDDRPRLHQRDERGARVQTHSTPRFPSLQPLGVVWMLPNVVPTQSPPSCRDVRRLGLQADDCTSRAACRGRHKRGDGGIASARGCSGCRLGGSLTSQPPNWPAFSVANLNFGWRVLRSAYLWSRVASFPPAAVV